jgi:6-phosphogluconolactonase (cycloisomerase 2 family)
MSFSKVALYSCVGPELTRYEVDVEKLELTRRETISAPANVQYVWPHPSRDFLYLVSSPRRPREAHISGGHHDLCAYRIDRSSGALSAHGAPLPLTHRPIHLCLDATGRYAFVAYNNPSALTVHRINGDGTLGETIAQKPGLDFGIFAHQVRVTPDNRQVILVTRGNSPEHGKPEDPGALKIFSFEEGLLKPLASVAPGGGYGFGPRHLDFHPSLPRVYVSLERQDQLQVFSSDGGDYRLIEDYTRDTLIDPANRRPRQLGGTVHVHPNGRSVYIANRSDHAVEVNGKKLFAGGENNIAVFSLDPQSGEPTLIQHIDTEGIHVRTFALDPTGKMLVAASLMPLWVDEGGTLVEKPAGLSVFRVAPDGRLEYVRRYAVDTASNLQFWMGMIGF